MDLKTSTGISEIDRLADDIHSSRSYYFSVVDVQIQALRLHGLSNIDPHFFIQHAAKPLISVEVFIPNHDS